MIERANIGKFGEKNEYFAKNNATDSSFFMASYLFVK